MSRFAISDPINPMRPLCPMKLYKIPWEDCTVPACHLIPQFFYSPMGWTGLSMGFSHVPPLGISQCPIPSHSPVGWTGLCMGFSHVSPWGISQCPVPSHSPVGWTGLLNFLPALKSETFSTLPGRVRQNASFYHYFLLYISCTLRCSCCFLA